MIKNTNEVTEKITMDAEDERLSRNDAHILNHIETQCVTNGFAYVNARRIIVPDSSTEIKENVHTILIHGIYVCIDFITKKGEEITEEMRKTAEDFINNIVPSDIDMYKAADIIRDIAKDQNTDEASLINLRRSAYKRKLCIVIGDENELYLSMSKLFGIILYDRLHGIK